MMRQPLLGILEAYFLMVPVYSFAKKIDCVGVNVEIYENDITQKKYFIIGKILRDQGMPTDILCEMKKTATKLKGDAIIQYSVETFNLRLKESVDYLIGEDIEMLSKYKATGIVVRWAGESEQGINKIGSSTPIPVIFFPTKVGSSFSFFGFDQ